MKKRIISLLIVCLLVMSLLPTFAFAAGTDTNTATITAFAEGGAQVGTTYATIDSAAAAAGVGGTVRISAGDYYFNARQTISVAGVTLEGAGKDATKLYASSAFAGASATNKKALLCIAADGVTVKNLTLDGSPYGSTLQTSDDFVVLRANSGTGISLDNIYVTGSPRSLITVGTSSTSAAVAATNLYCQADETKTMDKGKTYADINITKGSFTLGDATDADEKCEVHGFISKETAGTFVNNTENHYRLTYTVFFILQRELTSTVKHFANTFVNNPLSSSVRDLYADAIEENVSVVGDMVDEAITYVDTTDEQIARNLLTVIDYALTKTTSTELSGYRTELYNAINHIS